MSNEVTESTGTRAVVGVVAIALALVVLAGLLAFPALNVSVVIPIQHFYVVSAVSLLALLVAVMLSISAAQLQHYKLLLLGVGFMSMAGLFSVHGLATPGVMVPIHAGYVGEQSVVQVAGFLALVVPAVFFAAGYLPLLSLYERCLPFWPAGALVLVALSALAVFAGFAFINAAVIADLPIVATPVIYVVSALAAACLLFAGYRQFSSYRLAGMRLQGSLALAFPLLACALLAQVITEAFTLAWWEYHLLMLIAVGLAFVALTRERRRGKGYRTILEAALDLQVRAEIELEHVAEITALAAAIEAKDRDTRGHTVRVAELTVGIARELGMSAPTLRYMARAGLLHDIGKLHIPDSILLKPGPLDDEEWVIMKRHPEMGLGILRRLGKFEKEAEVVIAHHERIDRSGYPHRLRGTTSPSGHGSWRLPTHMTCWSRIAHTGARALARWQSRSSTRNPVLTSGRRLSTPSSRCWSIRLRGIAGPPRGCHASSLAHPRQRALRKLRSRSLSHLLPDPGRAQRWVSQGRAAAIGAASME